MAHKDLSELRINPLLPNIIISKDKINLFVDWYNKDIRFQKELPHTFEKGYIRIKSMLFSTDISNYNVFIKALAKQYNKTYRQIENMLKLYVDGINDVTVYFEFKGDMFYNYIYRKDGKILSKAEAQIGDNKQPSPEITLTSLSNNDINKLNNEQEFVDDIQNKFNYFCLAICSTCLWYLATTTKTTKYKYKERPEKEYNPNKRIVYVKENKNVTTPIYILDNIKIKTVDRLINKREGYTYSHSFQVHGHYRHYKDGKVVFINSYIKGKDKPFKHQNIIINPKEN